jgi:hypothetical protein
MSRETTISTLVYGVPHYLALGEYVEVCTGNYRSIHLKKKRTTVTLARSNDGDGIVISVGGHHVCPSHQIRRNGQGLYMEGNWNPQWTRQWNHEPAGGGWRLRCKGNTMLFLGVSDEGDYPMLSSTPAIWNIPGLGPPIAVATSAEPVTMEDGGASSYISASDAAATAAATAAKYTAQMAFLAKSIESRAAEIAIIEARIAAREAAKAGKTE